MTVEVFVKPLHEFETLEAARAAANDMAIAEMSYALAGNFYMQGGRRFVSLVLPIEKLFELAIQPERPRRGDPKPDPALTRNRPIDTAHVRAISAYLQTNETYLLPPVIVNSSTTLDIFVAKSELQTRPCVLVIPKKDALYVTDGQHRVEALRQASQKKPALSRDAIGITLIEEMDLERIHQDFYDAAQTKKLEPALLVEYDGRSVGNTLAREICASVPLFIERTERFSNTIGKNSLKLYSTNQVKQACFHLILGEVKGKNQLVLQRVNEKIAPAYEAYKACLQAFFQQMTALNPQWREIINRPPSSGQVVDPVPGFRNTYLHCVAGGLNVLCAVGHAILSLQATVSADFTGEQLEKLERLATLDWSRDNPLWHGGIVSTSGSITPHRGNLALAIAQVKGALGFSLTSREEAALERSLGLTTVGTEAPGEEA